MSTLFVNNLNTASGTTITVPTGKTLVGTDTGTLRMPGSAIQIVRTANATVLQGTFATQTNVLSLSITPKASNSIIHIQGAMQLHNDATGSYWMLRLMRDSTQVIGSMFSAFGYQLAAGERDMLPINHTEVSGSTSARTYHIACHRNSGTGTMQVNYGNYGNMTIIEYAQ